MSGFDDWTHPDDERYPLPRDHEDTCANSRCGDEPDPGSTTGLCTWHMAVEDGDGEDDA